MANFFSPSFRWLGLLGFSALILLGASAPAQAQEGKLWLYSPQKTYTPGQDVVVYAFFFRVPATFGFFDVWGRHLGSNRNFVAKSRRQISSINENLQKGNGEVVQYSNMLYRVVLKPRSSASRLTYGPINFQMQFNFRQVSISSNTLVFPRGAAKASASMTTEIILPKGKQQAGIPIDTKYRMHCPQSLCNYRRLNPHELATHFRRKARLSSNQDFWVQYPSLAPQIIYDDSSTPRKVTLQFNHSLIPLRGGTLQTPPLALPVPVIESTDQHQVSLAVQKWLKTQGLSASEASRLVQLREPHFVRIKVRSVTIPSKPIEMKGSGACSGEWNLASEIVLGGNAKPLWHVRLEGKGFILLADTMFRQMLQDKLKEKGLLKKLRLKDYRWNLPDSDLHGRVTIDFYFSFVSKRVALPELSMNFVNNKGERYTRKTSPLGLQSAAGTMPQSLALTKDDRRVYINYNRKPTKDRAEEIDVWGYKVSESFPMSAVLARKWKFLSPLTLRAERKTAMITRRNSFGGMVQVFSHSVGLEVIAGKAIVQEIDSFFAKFPVVRWGHQWVQSSIATSRDLFIEARTLRKSYFAGEAIVYQLQVHCPVSSCPEKTAGFYAQIFNKHLTLPNFKKFPTWRRIENFVRHEGRPGWVVFRYRVRFPAPSVDEVKLEAARLRLSNHALYRLQRAHNICLFQTKSREQVIQQAILRDHYQKSSGQQCAIGTRELSTLALKIPIRTLPAQAKGVQLIGSFQLTTELKQLSYPTKYMTQADKPFYFIVTISGDGDLATARLKIRDQLDALAPRFRKKNVTTYTELPDDKAMRKQGKTVVQLQLIPEEPATVVIPTLILRYFHREEGLLKAQTLPVTIKVVPRTGGTVAHRPPPRVAPANTTIAKIKATELRPNALLGEQGLQNEYFMLKHWLTLVLLGSPLVLFLLFLGWHQRQKHREENPHLQERQRALKEFRGKIKKLDVKDEGWARGALQAVHSYLIDRLSLSKKQLTSREISDLLQPYVGKDELDTLIEQNRTLEDTIYGGSEIEDPAVFLPELEKTLRHLDRAIPKS